MTLRNLTFLVAATAILAASIGKAGSAGTVTGTIAVEQTRVKTDGPKSFKDVIVSLTAKSPGEHPAPAKHVEMDQRGLVFIPHVMAVQAGTPVDFLNNDNDRHNVYFLYEDTGKTLDIGTWGPGQTVTHTFDRPGEVITLCQLHLEMAAYILVFDHPFFTVAEIDEGTQSAGYALDNVPPGLYQLEVWHKKLKMKGEPIPVEVKAGQAVHVDVAITRSKYAR